MTKGITRIANVDGEICVLVDGVAIHSKVARATLDAISGQPSKLFLEFDIEQETNATYDELQSSLSMQAKAICAIEVLQTLRPEDIEDALAGASNGQTWGVLVPEVLAELIADTYLPEGGDDGDSERPEPGSNNENVRSLFG